MGSITNYETGSRPKIFVLDPYHEDAINLLQSNSRFQVVLPSDPQKQNWHTEATAVLVRSETQINASDIERANPGLKCIVKQGVGVDNIDLIAARAKGVKVFNTPGLNSETVAELTLTLALCVSRRICEIDERIRSGNKVIRSQTLGQSLYRKTLGVIGMGNIGRELAKKWVGALEGNIVAYDPYASEGAWNDFLSETQLFRVNQLEKLLQEADVVTIHVPLTDSTKNLISTKEFQAMKKNSILLNCARGGIVDEAALLDALRSGHLFGAGLDAMQYEPPTLSQYGETLLACPRVVMTPHIGASTVENQAKCGVAAVRIALDLLEGRSEGVPKSLA